MCGFSQCTSNYIYFDGYTCSTVKQWGLTGAPIVFLSTRYDTFITSEESESSQSIIRRLGSVGCNVWYNEDEPGRCGKLDSQGKC